jgi:hypothetical protein
MRDKNFSKDLDNLIEGMNKPSTPTQQVRTAEEIPDSEIEKIAKECFVEKKNKTGDPYTQVVGGNPNGWKKHLLSFKKGFKAAMELYRTQPEEREERIASELWNTNVRWIGAYNAADWMRNKYKEWCKETKRGGAILVGGSINEFFDWLDKPAVNK